MVAIIFKQTAEFQIWGKLPGMCSATKLPSVFSQVKCIDSLTASLYCRKQMRHLATLGRLFCESCDEKKQAYWRLYLLPEMWQSSSFRLHPAPCYTPVGSAQMGGHCAKLRESVTFSILLKDSDKGRVSDQDCLLHKSARQVSTAATVSLTLRSYPCWYSAWAMFAALFCFIVRDAAFKCEMTFGWFFLLALGLLYLFSFGCPSPELQLRWLHRPRSPCKEGKLTQHRKPVSLLLLAADWAAVF